MESIAGPNQSRGIRSLAVLLERLARRVKAVEGVKELTSIPLLEEIFLMNADYEGYYFYQYYTSYYGDTAANSSGHGSSRQSSGHRFRRQRGWRNPYR